MAGVQLDGVQLLRVGADGVHERQRLLDLPGEPFVAQPRRRGADEVGVPGVDLTQVRVPAADERARKVQRRRRRVVHPQQPVRVRTACLRGELEPVHRVATVGRQRDLAPGLVRA